MAKRVRREYRKNTPIGRLRRNVEQMRHHAGLLLARITSWGSDEGRLAELEKRASTVVTMSGEMDEILVKLDRDGFVPPEKSRMVKWEIGQRVAIAQKFRSKYEAAFKEILKTDDGFLDDLRVDSELPTGEISVRRRGRSPFIVPKTHLVGVEEDGG